MTDGPPTVADAVGILRSLGIAFLVGACMAGTPGTFPPIDPNRLGVVVPGLDGGPDVECRAIDVVRCQRIAQPPFPGVDPATIDRIVVSCEGPPCTAAAGAFRSAVVTVDRATMEVGRGAYGDAAQPTPPPAN